MPIPNDKIRTEETAQQRRVASKIADPNLLKNKSGILQAKLQGLANDSSQVNQLKIIQEMANQTVQKKTLQKNGTNTGLPNQLKSGVEDLSGISMDDVKVHYNSSKPAQLQAHAYAQGTDIHLGAGQEKHLPHEAWHVVQQKQGRVKPTVQLKGKVNVNDDAGLEREADVMGGKAMQLFPNTNLNNLKQKGVNSYAIQRARYPWTPIPIIAALSQATWINQVVNKIKTGNRFGTNDPAAQIALVNAISLELGRYIAAAGNNIEQLILLGEIQTQLTNLIGEHTREPLLGLLSRDHVWHTLTRFRAMVAGVIDNHDYGYDAISDPAPLGPNNAVDDYHFGLNLPGTVGGLGPRMDHIHAQHAGTIAEYDWQDPGHPIPAHITALAGHHSRLGGAPLAGVALLTVDSQPRIDAQAGTSTVYPEKFLQHTRAIKQHNIIGGKAILHHYNDFNPGLDVHAGVDFSKSALADQLVQGKKIHFHLTGLEARWRVGGAGNPMTGQDFQHTLNKNAAYSAMPGSQPMGSIKDDVTLRELRFIHRYWDARQLTLEPDQPPPAPGIAPITQQYSFKGNVIFYYKPPGGGIKRVPPPWLWGHNETGHSMTGLAPADIHAYHNRTP